MSIKYFVTGIAMLSLVSCSKYSGPQYNSADPNPTKTEGTIPENLKISKKILFNFDGVAYEGVIDVAEKGTMFASFQRNGIKHVMVLDLGTKVGKYGSDQENVMQLQISKFGAAFDTVWIANQIFGTPYGDITFSDGRVIVGTFNASLEVYPTQADMGSGNHLENNVLLTDGSFATEMVP